MLKLVLHTNQVVTAERNAHIILRETFSPSTYYEKFQTYRKANTVV